MVDYMNARSTIETLENRTLFAVATDLDLSFSGDGKVITDFGGADDVARAVAVQSDGKIVVAGETPVTVNGVTNINFAVVRFNKDGKYLASWGKPGAGPGEFNLAHALVIDSKGNLYASDHRNNRIQIFDGNGKFLKQWTNLGPGQGLYMTPNDELWAVMIRSHEENLASTGLAGKIMKIDIATGAMTPVNGLKNLIELAYLKALAQIQKAQAALPTMPTTGTPKHVTAASAAQDQVEDAEGAVAVALNELLGVQNL